MTLVTTAGLRTRFAQSLSDLYGSEVPAYTQLVEVSQAVNADVMARCGEDAERLGAIGRVSAERHGAIRVGTPDELATEAFALSPDPVDRAWYDELHRISGVAADVGGVTTTHINHLTPRVLDIDDLYRRMDALGVAMIEQIQRPPDWDGPEVLLRQTSFRALAEPRTFREPDGSVVVGDLRVRFGEVEARGIALTRKGRAIYDELVARVDALLVAAPQTPRQEVAEAVWGESMPRTEIDLARSDLGFFTFDVVADRDSDGTEPPSDLSALLDGGWIRATPIVYEDFLPRSAAGIFSSNLADHGTVNLSQGGALRDIAWMSHVMGCVVHDPTELYERERQDSVNKVAAELGIDDGIVIS